MGTKAGASRCENRTIYSPVTYKDCFPVFFLQIYRNLLKISTNTLDIRSSFDAR